ncbi:MAG: TrkA family potassium uptake protein [Actinobacteria bacterium]|nr:MAG: TrkA family potassium uptake protein [Actinomycetota bacterium]
MHVVIGGYGRVGRYLAKMLEFEGHTVAVIDQDPLVFEEEDDVVGAKLVGPVFDRDLLEEAGIERADVFAAVTSGDNSNIVAARTAKEHYRVPRVLARIYDPRRAEIYRELGIPTIASVSWASTRLLDMISHPELHSVFEYGNAEVEMVEVEVPMQLVGNPITTVEVPGEIAVATVLRGHAALLRDPSIVFERGDVVYLNVLRESTGKLQRLLAEGE